MATENEARPYQQHNWVQWSYMPVEVNLVMEGDEPTVTVAYNDDDLKLAEDQAKQSCFSCEVELSPATVLTECTAEMVSR